MLVGKKLKKQNGVNSYVTRLNLVDILKSGKCEQSVLNEALED